MSIRESLRKIKASWQEWRREGFSAEKLLERDAFVGLVVLFVAFSSFALGRISMIEANKPPVRILFPEEGAAASAILSQDFQDAQENAEAVISSAHGNSKLPPQPVPTTDGSAEGKYVASKSGTKYHLPWCSGAKRIKEENKIWFATKEEAESRGYSPAANCKGI